MSQGHFTVVRAVHGKQPWFARYQAANGREIWRTSETYARKRAALAACGNFAVAMVHPSLVDRWGLEDAPEPSYIWFTRDEAIPTDGEPLHTWRVAIAWRDEVRPR